MNYASSVTVRTVPGPQQHFNPWLTPAPTVCYPAAPPPIDSVGLAVSLVSLAASPQGKQAATKIMQVGIGIVVVGVAVRILAELF